MTMLCLHVLQQNRVHVNVQPHYHEMRACVNMGDRLQYSVVYMSCPIYCHGSIYCHGPIYCHSPTYCHYSIYGMTFTLFRVLCLEGASSCCFDLYACRTFFKPFEKEGNRLRETFKVFQLTIFKKKIGLSRDEHTLQGEVPSAQALFVRQKRDAKRKTCCVPTGARQNVVVVGL